MKLRIIGLSIALMAFAACDPPKTIEKSDEKADEEQSTQKVKEPKPEDDEPKIPRQEMSWIPEQPDDMEPIEVAFVPTEGFAARGASEEEALVTIVEIGDYGCPDTEARRELVEEILDDYGTKIRYVYRNVVWVPGEYGPFAANLAAAAAQHGKYWTAYEVIWQRFRKLDEYSRDSYLEPLDLTLRDLKMAETFAKNVTDQNQELAKKLNVQWVPTFFVNGVPLVKVGDEVFKKYVEVQIDKAQALQEENPDLSGEPLYRELVDVNAEDQKLPEEKRKEKEETKDEAAAE